MGFANGPDQPALTQAEGIDLQLKLDQGAMIQQYLGFRHGESRAENIIGPAETNVLGDQPMEQMQTQPGELKFDPALTQLLEQGIFYKIRESDLIDVNVEADQPQDDQQDGDPEASKVNSDQPPKTSFWSGGSHINKGAIPGRPASPAMRPGQNPDIAA